MNKALYWTFLIFFITHIPITICLDSQALLGLYYPSMLRDIYSWYATSFHDELMANPPLWLLSFIFLEIFTQLPFFFVASYAFIFKYNWIRIPSIAYGAHVATTVVPILTSILSSPNTSINEKAVLFSFYFPYLFIPSILAIYMMRNEDPFNSKEPKKKT